MTKLARLSMLIVGAMTVLSGCGADDSAGSTLSREPRASTTSLDGTGGIVVAALGDSITAGTPSSYPDANVRNQVDRPDRTNQWTYWAARKNRGLAFRNCGVNRQTTGEIQSRLGECAAGADVLVVQGGINDIAQGRSLDDAARNLRDMVREGKAMGMRVVLVDVLPWNAGYPRFVDEIEELNRRIAAIAIDEDIPLLEFHKALEDPAKRGRMRAEYTIDGSHPSPAGHRVLGEVAFRVSVVKP